MTLQELKQLLDKYKNNSISEDERQLLLEQVTNGEFAELIKADILESLYNVPPGANLAPEDANAMLDSILQTGRLRAARKRVYIAAAAAAILAGLLITGIYVTRQPATGTLAKQHGHPGPIQPGSNKAMLTLGDGSVISLDSASNGTLATQGATRITNANGALNYSAANNSSQVMYNKVTTPHGGQYELTLADGSHVWLNAASSIRFPTAFNGKERMVEITGEVYFEVAPHAGQPFKVNVKSNDKEMSVDVLGTSFNVMAYDDEQAVKTTLVNGAVELHSGTNSSLLKPGLQASLGSNAAKFDISAADLEQTLAWKDGKFRFRNTNIKAIMRQLSRWYDINVAYQGDVTDIDLTGVLSRRDNAENLLNALEQTQRVHFEVNGNKIVVMPSGLQ